MEKKIYCIIQYHNYRKEHFGKLIGVFTNKNRSITIFNKNVEQYKKTCFSKDAKIVIYNTKNNNIVKIVILKDDPDDMELMIFKLQIIKKIDKTYKINDNKIYNICLYYEIPIWVLNIKPTICNVLDIKENIFNNIESVEFNSDKGNIKNKIILFSKLNKEYKYLPF